MESVKCFMVEPVYGDEISYEDEFDRSWEPNKYIIGFIRPDTNEHKGRWEAFGPGAMIFATWYPKGMTWEDETQPHLLVRLPNGSDWDIDSRCRNCSLPEDNKHRCWVRHGVAPNVSVNKSGATCQAGAGSISTEGWHGMLTDGELREL